MKMTVILCFGKTKKMPAAADIFDWFHFLYFVCFFIYTYHNHSECICIVKNDTRIDLINCSKFAPHEIRMVFVLLSLRLMIHSPVCRSYAPGSVPDKAPAAVNVSVHVPDKPHRP